jgi:hypothetical protein
VPVVVVAGRAADLRVLLLQLRAVVAQRDQRRRPDRDRVRAERKGLGDVGARPDPARHDQLHLPVHVELGEGVDREPHRRERWDADVLDEDVLRRGSPALHSVHDDHIRSGLHGELDVVVRPRRADLHEDRLLPVGDLPQLADLDLEVVRARPVGMARGAALVDPLRKVAHLGDAVGDLVAEQHSAPARLRALADDHLDRVRAPQVVGIHAVAGGEELVDEDLGVLALLRRHAAVARGRRGADLARSPAERFLRGRGKRAEAHAGDRHRDGQLERLPREARPQRDACVAPLPVALERVAGDARAEQEQVVEVGQRALRAEAADFVDALARCALDLGDDGAVEEGGLTQVPGARGHGCPFR